MLTPVPPTAPSSTTDAPGDITIAASSAAPRSPTTARSASSVSVGQNFGTRYHIIRLLGVGGMGAVYQAWDAVLEVAVAIKVIRLDAAMDDESARAVLIRFKRELLLARQVTHTNVVRIHDIGEVDGITYITMPYVQGIDLWTMLKREGRVPVDRAIAIAKQVASGLVAAHEAGVVHRDLKPANIMVTADDHALIMDFGIARSTGGTLAGMTATGAVVGTMEYMAPEQARGAEVDQRADIYSFGLILNDMLLGRRQQAGGSSVAELLDRMTHAPPAVRTIDPTIPEWLDVLITRCLHPHPAARLASMREVLAALEQPGTIAPPVAPPVAPAIQPATEGPQVAAFPRRQLLAAGVAIVLVLAGIGLWTQRDRLSRPSQVQTPAGPPVSLAILPFRNVSNDPTLDSLGPSLSQVLATTLGQSARIRTVPPNRLQQVLRDLRIAQNAALSPVELAQVADFTSAGHVLWGQYTRFGAAIRVDATLQDLERHQTTPLNAVAPNEEGVLTAVTTLADAVRAELARGSPDLLTELKSTSWRPSTASFEALRLYNEGVQLTQQGTHQEALKRYEAAVRSDASFALAYSALAQSYAALGHDAEATQFSRRALSLSDNLPPQEKHRIAANHYRIANDTEKAIEAYENLAKASPTDAMVHFDLGSLYEQSGALDQAREHLARVVNLDPKFVAGLLAMGRVEIRQGNPQGSLEHLDKALGLAIQLEQNETRADVLQAIGIAYMRLNRRAEALKRYQESLEIKQQLGNKRGMAASYVQIGEVQKSLGNPKQAEQSYQSALKLRREIGDRSGTALTLMELAGLYNDTFARADEALPLLQEALTILRDVGNRNLEARALNNIGAVYGAQGRYSEAETFYERALEIREKVKAPQEMADTLHNLGETLTKMGRYDQALQRYVRALEVRRGIGDKRATAIESYGIGTLFDYQGRYGAAVNSKQDALNAFRELKLREVWLSEILGGLGGSLSLSGRMGDAAAPLDESLALAKELNNQRLVALALQAQSARLYFTGDAKGALQLAERAVEAANASSDRAMSLSTQAHVTLVASASQPTGTHAATLATLAQRADSQGLQALAVDCSIQRAEVLAKSGDAATALRDVDRALARAETLGLRVSLAKAHFVKASILRARGDLAARAEYASTLRLLEQLRADDGNQDVLKRADLAALYAEAGKWSKVA